MNPLFLAVCALVLALIVVFVKRRAFVRRVDAIPGPPGSFVFGNLFTVINHNFEVLAVAQTFSQEFQDICRVWIASFPYVLINKVEYLEIVMTSMQHIDKSSDYSVLHPWLRLGLLTSTSKKWQTRRRLITPSFHFKILDEFIPIFNRNTAVMAQKLSVEAQRGKPFNISHYVHLCTLDIICESAMGTTVHAQENAESEYVNAVKIACCKAYHRLVKPWIYPNLTFYATPGGWSFKKAVRTLHKLTESVIKARKEEVFSSNQKCSVEAAEDGVKKRVAFLDQLLLANIGGAGLSDIDIQEEVDTFMFEGHDTTGTAISFALYELSKNQDVQDLAYQEVLSILGPEAGEITMKNLNEMKYLELVIKEVLRLYPSVPVMVRGLKTDLHLPGGPKGGYVVPAGCSIILCPYTLHRLESIWPDPERFDPDRFLPENRAGRHPFAYIPFSAGPRNCIGQKYAMAEMKVTLARLLLEYRVSEAYPGYKPEVVGELILKPRDENGIQVRLEKRQHLR